MVAKYWGITPWEFRSLTPNKKAELFAHWLVQKEVEIYEKVEANKQIEQQKK